MTRGAWPARAIGTALPPALLLVAGLLLFPSAGRDDAHITYWSAWTLSERGEILNYNGDRVEQSSSLLHVLLLAAVHRVGGVDPALAGRVLSVLCALLTLVAARGLGERIEAGAGLATALVAGSSVFFVYWAFGGLESSLASLAAVLLILAWASHLRAPRPRSLAAAALAAGAFGLVRPEAPLVMACMLPGLALLLAWGRRQGQGGGALEQGALLARLRGLLAVTAGVAVLIFAFRLLYFGALFPQPVIAKSVGPSWQRALDGLHYLLFGMARGSVDAVTHQLAANAIVALVLAVAVLGAFRAARAALAGREANPHTLLSLVFLAAYFGYVVTSGGDWMEGGRMVSHAVPVSAAFVASACFRLAGAARLRTLLVAGLVCAQVFALLDFAASRSVGMPLWTAVRQVRDFARDHGASRYAWFDRSNRDHLRNIPTLYQIDRIVGQLLEGDREVVHIAAHQMGVMPYYLTRRYFGRVRFLDLNGLTDRVATDAEVFASLPRSVVGVDGVFIEFITQRAAVEADPDFVRPDLTVHQFYQYPLPPMVFEQLGYRIVYEQTGDLPTGSRHFPGWRMWANQLVTVRHDLLRELEERPPRRIDIRDTGVVRANSAW